MIRALLLLVVASCTLSKAGPSDLPTLTERVWVHYWAPPRRAAIEGTVDYFTRTARLARFSARGEFVMVDCVLILGPALVSVSSGDGQNVFVGSWSVDDDTLSVEYELRYRTSAAVGESLPAPTKHEEGVIGEQVVSLGTLLFEPLPRLAPEELDPYVALARKERQREGE